MAVEEKHQRPESGLPEDQAVLAAGEIVHSEPFCIHDRKTKWLLVGMVALTGFLSPFPANIYFPVIPTLAEEFHVSIESMNLTVMIYLAFQGVSPMLWGPLSDRWGRRPIFLACLAILVASCVGLALTPTNAFWLLLLLRAIQAGGCASTIALGAGVIGDISTPEERGGFFGMFNLGPMLAPCVGPVLGGVLSDKLGWRSIMWFLAIFSGVCFFIVLLFLPETMRTLAGNGSIAPPGSIYHAWIPIVRHGSIQAVPNTVKKKKPTVNPLIFFLQPDIMITLFYTGIVYAVNYTITATISSAFAKLYPFLSATTVGLCYLSTGGGMIFGSTLTGKMLDWDYRRMRRQWVGTDGVKDDFPLEKSRLRTMPILLAVYVGSVVAWGWCLEFRVSIAGPLVFQFVLGYTSISILNATMTLMIDIVPGQSSGVIACTNLVRCSLAALLVSFIDKLTQSLGYGWAHVLMGGICALLVPLVYVEVRKGGDWRRRRISARDGKEVEG